jgi:transposase
MTLTPAIQGRNFFMREHNSGRWPYPSDLTERQWNRIVPLLPESRSTGRRRRHSLRQVLDAINYRWETGCAWRMLPHDFPPWGTVYTYYRRWQRTGLLPKLRDALLQGKRRDRVDRLDPRRPPGECTTASRTALPTDPPHAGSCG